MEREYEIFLTEEPAARAHARTRAADDFDVDRDSVSVVGVTKLEDRRGLIGWLVKVRVS